MNERTETDAPVEILDLAAFDAADEAEMTVVLNGAPTTWVWTFAGPGHARTIDQVNRLARESLHRSREQEQARTNGRKWKAPEDSPEELRARNVAFVVDRLLRWSPIRLSGQDLPFSRETAKKLLMDPRKATLLTQAIEFLGDERSFTPRSATN